MAKKHISANPSHYDYESETYDLFNEGSSAVINKLLEKVLKKYSVKAVLDLTCGTGSQVFWLSDRGFTVQGVDINEKMLQIAKCKAQDRKDEIMFKKGDMRKSEMGQFDAVITIFNSIGHLTKPDFKKALINIKRNLRPGGIYVFDIFNLNHLLHKDNITKLTIDWLKRKDSTITREIQYSTIDIDGVLTSYDFYYETSAEGKKKHSKTSQTLQVYSKHQLAKILKAHGFTVLSQISTDGSRFSDTGTERILTVARAQ